MTRALTVVLSLALLLAPNLAAAQEMAPHKRTPAHQVRIAPPVPGTPKDVTLPAILTEQLGNGLAVTLVPFGSVPKVTISVQVDTGLLDAVQQDRGGPALVNLASALMAEGTAGLDPAALDRKAGAMGGSLAVGGGRDGFSASISVLSEHAAEALQLVADALRRPDFPAAELPRLKQDALRGLAVARTNPQSLAGEAFAAAFYGAHPYARALPDADSIAAIAVDDIRSFHAANFGAQRTRLYIAGQFDPDAIMTAVRAAFGDWQRGPTRTVNPPVPARALSVTLIDRPDAPQSTIYLGLPLPPASHPDRTRIAVMDDLLGGTFMSRLTRNLREDKGYAYSPGSSAGYGPGFGSWVYVADVTTAHTADALREIRAEIARLKQIAPLAPEVARIQNHAAGGWVLGTATRGALLGNLAYYDFHGLPHEELASYVSRVRAVTGADVQAVAQRYLDLDLASLVIVGDLAQVGPQLEALDWLAAAMKQSPR